LQSALMMRKRMGADMTRNKSAAFSKTSSDSVRAFPSRDAVLDMVSIFLEFDLPRLLNSPLLLEPI
jgi:hypothetical protein